MVLGNIVYVVPEKPVRYMRELRCVLGDIFTHCGKNTTKKSNTYTSGDKNKKRIISTIPHTSYVESYMDRTLAFGLTTNNIVWMIDRLNEFGYDVISVTQEPHKWKPKRNDGFTIIVSYCNPNHNYYRVRKIEEEDLL